MTFIFRNMTIFWDIPKWNRGQTKWDGGSIRWCRTNRHGLPRLSSAFEIAQDKKILVEIIWETKSKSHEIWKDEGMVFWATIVALPWGTLWFWQIHPFSPLKTAILLFIVIFVFLITFCSKVKIRFYLFWTINGRARGGGGGAWPP